MRLYVTPLGQWAGTQADARTFKATHGVDFEQIEVPTDKPGLLEFLNRHEVGKLEQLPDRGGDLEDAAPDEAEQLFQLTHGRLIKEQSLDDHLEWIFHGAKPHEIERVFEALGCRFHEMRKLASA